MIAPRERSRSPKRNGKVPGVAKRWNDDKGFGFIKPDDGSEDIFCHRSSIEDGDCLIEGKQVWFVKGWDDRKSKEAAKQVTGGATRGDGAAVPPSMPAGGGGPPPVAPGGYYGLPPPVSGYAPPPSNSSMGVVKAWNEERGFGFIKPDDGTEDLFCHRTSIEGAESLPDGARVSFVKGYDSSKSKPKAEKVNIVGGAGAFGGLPQPYPPAGGASMFAGGPIDGWGAPPPYGGHYGAPPAPYAADSGGGPPGTNYGPPSSAGAPGQGSYGAPPPYSVWSGMPQWGGDACA
mmetsp:Transcript_30945/g.51261  ORF Transcript_30945/g.51261 Transcript_30945/m.51261 type:complete len:289 (-) Transcript_30945:339-1205(-)|eukprot:CAMPEP_0119309820 /NCGR_PEP_ID=MMETSP1333-20130426/16948_1 /TAXON_ID=418940 /ORGANISM="Scyphosphaera apsteinii, Strain RCC1455" /LENGTH=288 /DNA_ID=CAMNT_0007313869 /DNA_START=156 /DNA_END=1022 /DNA_ORIENTATION=-